MTSLQSILVTGGAGFVGSNIAVLLKEHFENCRVIAFDNLKRRGSELSLARLRAAGVEFVHGDVRVKEDLFSVGRVDCIIDCSAEPSVLAGRDGAPDYLLQTNLVGTIHCLEVARMHGAMIIFLSTSRVYPIEPINALSFQENETRFSLSPTQSTLGASHRGIAEDFTLTGIRSLYGATKLSSELLLAEYLDTYDLVGIVNRCGVLTGPWQMGKVDQGVVVLWAAKHIFGGSLAYIGYGGTGKQVRDILHIRDLFELLMLQLKTPTLFNKQTFNVGGGEAVSVSLCELTKLCQQFTNNSISIAPVVENRPSDLISYISDCTKVQNLCGWKPRKTTESIIQEIVEWITQHRRELEPILR